MPPENRVSREIGAKVAYVEKLVLKHAMSEKLEKIEAFFKTYILYYDSRLSTIIKVSRFCV